MARIARRWRWILAGTGLLVVTVMVVCWLMFQHVPAWYRPARIAPAQLQQVKNDLAAACDSFNYQLNSARAPFTFTLTQDQLNAWLAARESMDPKTAEWFPPFIQDPMILLEQDGIRLGVTYSGGGPSSVISARLTLHVEGHNILTRLDQVAGGSLGVPEALVRRVLEAVDARASAALADADLFPADKPRPHFVNLFEGIALSNRISIPTVDGGRYRLRVLKIDLQPGRIAFTLERLPRD